MSPKKTHQIISKYRIKKIIPTNDTQIQPNSTTWYQHVAFLWPSWLLCPAGHAPPKGMAQSIWYLIWLQVSWAILGQKHAQCQWDKRTLLFMIMRPWLFRVLIVVGIVAFNYLGVFYVSVKFLNKPFAFEQKQKNSKLKIWNWSWCGGFLFHIHIFQTKSFLH